MMCKFLSINDTITCKEEDMVQTEDIPFIYISGGENGKICTLFYFLFYLEDNLLRTSNRVVLGKHFNPDHDGGRTQRRCCKGSAFPLEKVPFPWWDCRKPRKAPVGRMVGRGESNPQPPEYEAKMKFKT
jgi:hypothetical protein